LFFLHGCARAGSAWIGWVIKRGTPPICRPALYPRAVFWMAANRRHGS
jgi:hypothetical protein